VADADIVGVLAWVAEFERDLQGQAHDEQWEH
jgi:hypothetical protein